MSAQCTKHKKEEEKKTEKIRCKETKTHVTHLK